MLTKQIDGLNGGESHAAPELEWRFGADDAASSCIAAFVIDGERVFRVTEVRRYSDGKFVVGLLSKIARLNGSHDAEWRRADRVQIRWKHSPCRFCFRWRVPQPGEAQA